MKIKMKYVIYYSAISAFFLLFVTNCQNQKSNPVSKDKAREFATVLYNQQLYPQAVKEYEDYLHNYPLDKKEQASISYTIANIYFDRMHDYSNALVYYLRIKHLYPESNLQTEVSKKIVECLERLQRSTDAQQIIEQTSSLDGAGETESRPGEVIATIGSRKITTGDLQFEINQLPVYMKDQVKTPDQKIDFLKNYIAQELLYDSAKRKGLDKDKDVLEGVFQAKKSLMSQKLLQQEIEQETGLDKYSNADIELYYKANKEKYAERDDKGKIKRVPEFSEVRQKVAQDFIHEKQTEAYQRLIDRLMQAQQVKIYESKFK